MEFRDVCFEIENDEFYRQFLHDKLNFNDSLNASEKVEKLTKGIEKLNSELETQVLSKHHDLLTQASHATNVEKVIGSMHVDAQSLLTGIEKLRSQVLIPYNMLESQTVLLSRIQSVCHIMRHASKIIQLCKHLNSLNDDPPSQANLLYEIDQFISDNDFNGINFLAGYLDASRTKKAKLIENASQQLLNGLNNGDKILLLSSFKVFNNLHCAKERIDVVITSVLNDVTQATLAALDVKAEPRKQGEMSKTGPGKANVINMQSFKVRFWENMDKLFSEHFYSSCKKIILLQNALIDLHSLENFHNVAKGFWEKMSIIFSTELKKSSGYASQCVEIDYPKLLKCYNDLTAKLHYKDFLVQRDILSYWENYFLSKSLEKLLDPVRAMWNSNQIPKTEEIDSAVRVISTALSVSLGDKQLSIALATSITKCIKQMSTEAEQHVCLESEAGQIIEAPSSSQQRNADISNALYYFTAQITRVLNNMANVLHPESVSIIQDSLKEISNVSVLQPFCYSINAADDLILGSMHSETELNRNDFPQTQNIPYSLYLRELQQFITRCKDIYLSLYQDTNAVNKCCEDIATHCIQVFIQNVCSLRPVSEYGRAKLQVDCKQLEVALKPLVADLSSLECYRELRAVYTLLSLTPSQILESQSKGASLPYSSVMMLLFSFGGQELLSPHQCAGWSHQKLLSWLSDHPNERDRLEFIAGALQRYQSHVRQNNISKYDDVYPILLQLLEDGRKYC